MLDLSAGLSGPILFLKATQKKQVFIPAFVRADGTPVAGHYKSVHVTDDHDDHKVAHGQGSHSQKIAHAKLAQHDWFHALPTEHKAAIVMAHATDHQDMDSANARASTLKKKILAGEKPTPSEWRAWGYVEADKRQKLYDEITEAGQGPFFQSAMDADAVAKGVEARKERLEHQPAAPADVKAAEQPKEEPKAEEKQPEPAAAPEAPKAEDKPAAPAQEPAKAAAGGEHADFLAKLHAAALPPENVNASSFNLKLKLIQQAFEIGDAKTLLGMSYGTNTYGKKAAKLVNEALAVLGHEHKVEPGQKAGAHPALAGDLSPKAEKEPPKDEPKPAEPAPAPQAAESAQPEKAEAAAEPAPAAEPVAEAPAASETGNPVLADSQANGTLAMPEFEEGKEKAGVKDYYEKVAQKIIDHASAGNVAVLEDMKDAGLKPNKNGKVGNTWKGKTGNSKKLLELYDAALAHAKGEGAAAAPAAPAAVDDGPKEGDTKTAADGGTLVLKDGHWIKQEEPQAAAAPGPHDELLGQAKAAGFEVKVSGIHGVVLANGSGIMKMYANKTQAENAVQNLKQSGFDAHVIGQHPFAVKITGKAAEPAPVLDAPAAATDKAAKHYVLDAENAAAKKGLVGQAMTAHVYEAAKQWLDAHPGKLEELNAGLDALGYAKFPEPAAAAAPAAPVPLTDAEIGDKPSGVNTDFFNSAKKAALAGDLAGLKKLAQTALDESYPNTANHLQGMAAALEAKQGGAQPAGVDEKAEQAAITMGEKMAADGELADLAELIQNTKGTVSDIAHKYLQKLLGDAKDKLAAEAAAAAGKEPPKPTVAPSLQSIVDDAKWAYDNGEHQTLSDIADYVKDLDTSADAPKIQQYVAALQGLQKPARHEKPAAQLAPEAAPAAPAAKPSITLADLPSIPVLNLQKNKDLAEHMQQLALAGDLAGIQALQQTDKVKNIGKLSGYSYQLTQALMQKGIVTPVPGADAAPAADQGPKDGDTKQGANGMLVFKDGRWHKMGDDPKVLAAKANSIGMPKLTGTASIKLTKVMKGLKEIAKEGGEKGLKLAVKEIGSSIQVSAGGYTFKFNKDLSGSGPNGKAAGQYIMNLMAAMEGTSGPVAPKVVGASSYDPAAAGEAAAAQEAADMQAKSAGKGTAAPIAGNKTEKLGKVSVMIADGWEQTGPQGGSNPGGRFKDAKGQEWYIKLPSDPDTVKNEMLAAKFYEMLGAKVPQLRLVKKDGKLGIASKWVDGIKKGSAEQLAAADGAHSGHVFDAWLANWDVVGLSNDNLMLDKDGKALRVDVGGSLVYRAMGSKKGAAFGNEVTELETLLDHGKNSKSAAVFAGISKASIDAGAKQLAKMHPSQIDTLVDMFGPGSDAEKAELAQKLKARREFILKKLGVDDPWNKPAPDLSKLPVNPDDMPPPINFSDYMGSGKGLSSKEHINKQNTIDDANLIAFAKQGNLKALQDYHYDAYDKETGKFIGKKPIGEHPNKDIKNHWASLCDLLTSVAHPPVEGLDLPPIGGGSIEEVAEQAGYFKPGENIKTISAEKVVGFWMKLGHVGAEAVADLMPQKPRFLKGDFVTKAKQWYKAASETTKALVNSIQDSGHYNRFWNNGDKHISISSGGHKYSGGAQTLASQIYQEAFEFDEGETIGRWMNLSEGMKQQLLKEGPGLVFQNADSMCASIFKDWGDNAKFGSGAFLNIKFAKGAKAMASLGSGRFKGTGQDKDGNYIHSGGGGEMEVTTLMGQRFVVLGIKQGNASSPNGITLDLLALPPHEGYVAELGQQAAMGKSLTDGVLLFLKSKGN